MALKQLDLQNIVYDVVENTWDQLDPDEDMKDERETMVFTHRFCNGIASGFDSWLQGGAVGGVGPYVSAAGVSDLDKALRTNRYKQWGESFKAYMNSVVWTPSAPPYLSIVLPAEPGDLSSRAKTLQVGLDAIVNAGYSGGESYKTRLLYATKLSTLLHTFAFGLNVPVIMIGPPPFASLLPIL